MRAVRVRCRHFNSRQPNGLNKNNLMRGIKIPQQDFALKMPGGGGLCARGGVFAGHYSMLFVCIMKPIITKRTNEMAIRVLCT